MANETITGKIFQLKDPTGTYNRFPRTVMEAVYGLNTYLQNQFSALADIYMPIEGITEALTDQEFVYRISPASIKAKSLTLDRLKGRTLAWNQLFSGDSASIAVAGVPITITDGHVVGSGTANTTSGSTLLRTGINLVIGHKYYIHYSGSHTGCTLRFYSGASYQMIDLTESTIVTADGTSNANFVIFCNSVGASVSIDCYLYFVDLTLLYGSEIDGLTDEQILAKYEADFGTGYHEYNAGTLISNDASALETVGFNQWDEEFVRGYYDISTGQFIESSNWKASKNAIPVIANSTYYNAKDGSNFIVLFYDKSGNFLGSEQHGGNAEFTSISGASFIRFYCTANTTHVCINLSDPAKNGTYEPYRKSTLHLGLSSFKVKDAQGNVMTITGGLKSAGSVHDEIVGNKYIKRIGEVDLGTLMWNRNSYGQVYAFDAEYVGTATFLNLITSKYVNGGEINASALLDKQFRGNNSNAKIYVRDDSYTTANDFKTAVSGVILYYELATPIEYTLVTPLVTTVKAGITEERISPNSDGLSAPFRADMTYDAQANNDSASAQYALTAGRLLNSHTLWGQDFDGTQDVAGALTGVTSITMNGALSGVTTISASGAVTLGSTLSVAGNTTIGGLATIAGGVKLTTTKKIWFDDTHFIELLNGYLHTNLPIVSDFYITAGAVNPNA